MTDQSTTTTVAVAEARSATADDDLDGAPVVVAVKLPAAPTRAEEVDVESQTQPPEVVVVTIVEPEHEASANLATTAPQQHPQDHQRATKTVENTEWDARKVCGIALCGFLVVGGVCWLFDATRYVTILCIPPAIVLSCICGFSDTPEKLIDVWEDCGRF